MSQISHREKITLLWLKRDLRFHDHAPLAEASERCRAGAKALAFYVKETDYWSSDKASSSQWEFVSECLQDLSLSLQSIGCNLYVFQAPSADLVLEALLKHYDIEIILCHQETGNAWTFERDKRLFRLAKERGIRIQEFLHNGVVRGQGQPGEQQLFWKKWAVSPQAVSPLYWNHPTTPPPLELESASLATRAAASQHQSGGEKKGLRLLESFFSERSLLLGGYRKEMGSPLHSHRICSRLSAHLSWGSLSTKSAAQKCLSASSPVREKSPDAHGAVVQYRSFYKRLLWRDHFIQKFERLSWMEFRCINPQMEHLHGWNHSAYERWASGMTGYPFVDACMRSLNETKWLNFRARAMLVCFASYALNLDWRGFGPHLARTFLDYEPGIHYSQLQMQGGTTKGSPPRFYNPITQSLEKDPEGEFIRRWIPELRELSINQIHFPSHESRYGYPSAIVPVEALWRTMRSNGPKKKKPTNQLEFSLM